MANYFTIGESSTRLAMVAFSGYDKFNTEEGAIAFYRDSTKLTFGGKDPNTPEDGPYGPGCEGGEHFWFVTVNSASLGKIPVARACVCRAPATCVKKDGTACTKGGIKATQSGRLVVSALRDYVDDIEMRLPDPDSEDPEALITELVTVIWQDCTDCVCNYYPTYNTDSDVRGWGGPEVTKVFDFNTSYDRSALYSLIDDSAHAQGFTHTSAGLKYIVDSTFTTTAGARMDDPEVTQVLVTITDGAANPRGYKPDEEAPRTRSVSGALTYAIGIGDQTNRIELDTISGDADRTFQLQSYSALQVFAPELAWLICQVATAASHPPSLPLFCQVTRVYTVGCH